MHSSPVTQVINPLSLNSAYSMLLIFSNINSKNANNLKNQMEFRLCGAKSQAKLSQDTLHI